MTGGSSSYRRIQGEILLVREVVKRLDRHEQVITQVRSMTQDAALVSYLDGLSSLVPV